MDDGWVETTLGACCAFIAEKLDPAVAKPGTPYVGLEHIEPGLGTVRNPGVAAQVSSLVNKYQKGDTLFGRLRPYLRKVVLADAEGVCSPEVLVLRPNTALVLPGFLHLLASSEPAIEHAVALSAGSRMPRTSVADLASLPVWLPPIPVQRRVVDLMGHLDNHLANLRAERDAVGAVMNLTLLSWDRVLDGVATVPLASLCTPRSGPSWNAGDESAVASPGSVRVVKITNTRPDGTLDMTDETYVVGVPPSAVRLNDRSLIMVRTNGNRDRIGNVYRPTPEAHDCVVSAFQFAAVLETVEARDWLYWWLKAPARQAAMTNAASGTTGLGNLAAGWVKAMEVPWPDEATRRRLTGVAQDLAAQHDNVLRETHALGMLRTALLGALLSGELIVPKDYDALLSEVA